jgi:osmotically-inducible protein OsmY
MTRTLIATLIAAATLAAAVPLAAAARNDAPASKPGSSQPVSDAWIKSKIVGEYAVNPHVSALKLDVKVDNGIAYLGGTANDATERDLAIEIARGVNGVREVRSQIGIQGTPVARNGHRTVGQGIDDATITAHVKSKLIANESTPAHRINVDTRRGVVTLKGTVDTDAEKELAGRLAENTEHVTEVHNDIAVAHR